MGSAICIPAINNARKVTLLGSPLDDHIVDAINNGLPHPNLNVQLPNDLTVLKNDQHTTDLLQSASVIIIGVSSAGIDWATQTIRAAQAQPELLSLVTKGLIRHATPSQSPLTYAHTLPEAIQIDASKLVGIGGPCIARELALGYPTRVVFGAHETTAAKQLKDLFQTDTYRIQTTDQLVELEACAALKNFLCIGVSSALGAHPLNNSFAKNPVAGFFNQAVIELRILSEWIAQAGKQTPLPTSALQTPTAFDLAGMGDLHVTVGGGRNSRLGNYLGQGESLSDVLENQMLNVTVEGVDTGRQIHTAVQHACASGELPAAMLPLTLAILDCIHTGGKFKFEFASLPG